MNRKGRIMHPYNLVLLQLCRRPRSTRSWSEQRSSRRRVRDAGNRERQHERCRRHDRRESLRPHQDEVERFRVRN